MDVPILYDSPHKVNRNNRNRAIKKTSVFSVEIMTYPAQLHRELYTKFELPDYYGENWDALWDCLDGRYEDDEDVIVEIKGLETMPDDMRQYAQIMLKVFDDVHSNSPNVKFEIK